MKIHGSTDIILKSKYGRVDRYHSDNTFQSGILAEGLRNLGYADASPYEHFADKTVPSFAEIVGGILLFDKDIPINSQFAPSGVQMIGNGAYGVANGSEPNELGSYNSAESIITPSSITQVYDWTTSQGNGTIRSVCLTSRTGGYIGYGNADEKQVSSLWGLNKNSGLANIIPQADADLHGNSIVCNGYFYNFEMTDTTTLTVKKWKIPLKNASVFDGLKETKTFDVSALNYSEMGTTFGVSASNGKIYLSQSGLITVGTAYLWEYDTATENTPTEITVTSGTNYTANGVYVAKGKIFINSLYSPNPTYVYNLDGSQYDTISKNIDAFTNDHIGEFGDFVLLNIHRRTGLPRQAWLYDVSTKSIRLTNASDSFGSNIQNQPLRMEETSKALTYVTASGVGNYFQGAYAFNNPLYLATINNLDNPVTKNLTMAMKVLYKLEQV